MTSRWPSRATCALAAVTVALAVATVPLVVISYRSGASDPLGEWVVGCYTPGFLVSGWWLAVRRPGLIIGRLYLIAGATTAAAGFAGGYAAAALAQGWPGLDWALWCFSWMWQPQLVLIAVTFLMFPDGRSGRLRWLVWVFFAVMVASMLDAAFRPGAIITTPDHPDGVLPAVMNPLGLEGADWLRPAGGHLLTVLSILGIIPMVVTGARWFRSTGVLRRQYKWATLVQVLGVPVGIAIFAAPGSLGPALAIAQTLAVQLLIVVAILQWRAYEVDIIVRRSVMAAALLVAGLGTYAAVVVVAATALGRFGPAASAIGAIVAIFAFGPMSTAIRAWVNRLFYGRRDDPYVVIGELGRHLAEITDPQRALAQFAESLVELMRFPSVAVLGAGGEELATAGDGSPVDGLHELALSSHGEQVGSLVVGLRRGTDELTPPEMDLLRQLANTIGASVQAARLAIRLQGARARLVVATEQERRRLQRDLHDRLGPQLTAASLKVDAARSRVRGDGDPVETAALLADTGDGLRAALAELRSVVRSLGDPTLASLGLRTALEDRVRDLARAGQLVVHVDIDDAPASAAVEEAVYRIAVEAVTNTVRHADATTCWVSLALEHGARLVVRDDGTGLPDDWTAGVGMGSMRDRVEMLGGSVRFDGDGTGLTVTAEIPEGAVS